MTPYTIMDLAPGKPFQGQLLLSPRALVKGDRVVITRMGLRHQPDENLLQWQVSLANYVVASLDVAEAVVALKPREEASGVERLRLGLEASDGALVCEVRPFFEHHLEAPL